ncbi:hypothetical protein SteCoe_19436 [Stentor coeruleus]|uniref:RING-type domain-containing protein n=1 Tax=Stentor coeruleus TaxID=5963 RepID=A0A1R2BU60_9CILI|nr:hypothetical protein SteCoe_19436 [Stentor coeruleus]
MNTIKSKYRDLGSLYSLRPKCNKCDRTLEKGKAFDSICDKCFQSSSNLVVSRESYQSICVLCETCKKNQCIKCNQICEATKSSSVDAVLNFIEVECYFHPGTTAIHFDRKTYLTYCENCQYLNNQKVLDLRKFNLYLDTIEIFRQLYIDHRKKLCPERRRSLIPYTTQELLNGIRFLMQIDGIRCDDHFEIALNADSNFKTYCEYCQVRASSAFSINDQTLASNLKDIIKNTVKNSAFNTLNKSILKISNKNLIFPSKSFPIQLMILEGKKFISNPDQTCQRCSNCLKLSIEGKQKPIILKCDHIICFECYFILAIERCQIDNSPIDQKSYLNYKNFAFKSRDVYGFSNKKGDLYKYSCTHIVSQEEFNIPGLCPDCLFPKNFFNSDNKVKIYEKAMALRDFYNIKCPFHGEPIQGFRMNSIALYCSECYKNQIEYDEPYFPVIFPVRTSFLENFYYFALGENIGFQLENAKKSYNSNQMFLKKISYFNILSYNERNDIYNKFLLAENKINSMKNDYNVIQRFKKTLPFNLFSRKEFFVGENDVVGFNLTCKKNIFLEGLVISLGYMKLHKKMYFSSQIEFIKIIEKEARTSLDNDEDKIISEKILREIIYKEEDKSLVFFCSPVLIQNNYNYDFIIKLTSLFYEHGLPSSRHNLDNLFTLSRLKNIPSPYKELGNSVIGGPILGFITSNFD